MFCTIILLPILRMIFLNMIFGSFCCIFICHASRLYGLVDKNWRVLMKLLPWTHVWLHIRVTKIYISLIIYFFVSQLRAGFFSFNMYMFNLSRVNHCVFCSFWHLSNTKGQYFGGFFEAKSLISTKLIRYFVNQIIQLIFYMGVRYYTINLCQTF